MDAWSLTTCPHDNPIFSEHMSTSIIAGGYGCASTSATVDSSGCTPTSASPDGSGCATHIRAAATQGLVWCETVNRNDRRGLLTQTRPKPRPLIGKRCLSCWRGVLRLLSAEQRWQKKYSSAHRRCCSSNQIQKTVQYGNIQFKLNCTTLNHTVQSKAVHCRHCSPSSRAHMRECILLEYSVYPKETLSMDHSNEAGTTLLKQESCRVVRTAAAIGSKGKQKGYLEKQLAHFEINT